MNVSTAISCVLIYYTVLFVSHDYQWVALREASRMKIHLPSDSVLMYAALTKTHGHKTQHI